MEDVDVTRRAAISRPVAVDPFQPISAAMSLELGAASIGGRQHAGNTDHYLALRFGRQQQTLMTSLSAAELPPRFEECAYAIIVADGLGPGGARASRVALSTLAQLAIRYGRWRVRLSPDIAAQLREQGEFLYRRTHEAVLRDGGGVDTATSLTALYIAEHDLFFAHVGHSNAFLFRDGELIQLTVAHTLDEERARVGRLVGLDPGRRDGAVVVTEAVGGRTGAPKVEIEHYPLCTGDRLLLCTNGLTDVVSDERIADVLAQRRRPQDDAVRLVELAVAAGHPDDATAVVADYKLPERPLTPFP